MPMLCLRQGILAVSILLPALASATVYQGNPSNYRGLVSQLRPGDVLQLAAGTYNDQLPITGLNGTAGAPIAIRGPQTGAPALFRASDCCNTVQFNNASYVEVSYLTLDGTGTNGAFGVDSRNATHHITVSDLVILNYGADQQNCGISTKGPAWNWIVRRNRIVGAGTGMYFGSSDGSFPFVAGLIENNVVLDTLGYSLQVKQQNPRPTNIGMPTGTSRTIIRNNVFSKSSNSSGGSLARPNVLVGHLPLSGPGQDDVYDIYGNFFYENPSEALFQGEGNIGLYNNLFVSSTGSAVNIVPHNAVPRAVTVFQNTVVAAGRGIYVTGGSSGYVQRIVGNAVFASPAISGPNQSGNIVAPYGSAHLYVNEPFAGIGALDLYPLPNMLTGAGIDASALTAYTDWNRDFNGTARNQTFRGAYSGAGTNPGWRLALAIKPGPGATVVIDSDSDGTPNDSDNCLYAANAGQQDTDGDGYGNACDADFDNTGNVNFADLALFRASFGTSDGEADLDGSGGSVNFADLARFRAMFGEPVGPSALAQ